jgi:uncharacterized protein GlcG (DUF336 family)|tara:strand:- start:229 stop:654 length:426 start_codon:yes stop_codon:yes gene_type:complete
MNKTHTQVSLTLESAQFLAQCAINKGCEIGINMNVVVVDIAGNSLVSLRQPGAPLPALDFARKKAFTAVCYGWPTDKWNCILADRPVITAGLAQHENIAMFGGGLPITLDGQVVGAIGVAGGKVDDDILCAKTALDAFDLL